MQNDQAKTLKRIGLKFWFNFDLINFTNSFKFQRKETNIDSIEKCNFLVRVFREILARQFCS